MQRRFTNSKEATRIFNGGVGCWSFDQHSWQHCHKLWYQPPETGTWSGSFLYISFLTLIINTSGTLWDFNLLAWCIFLFGQREKLSTQSIDDGNGKLALKPIMHFQTWRIGISFFFCEFENSYTLLYIELGIFWRQIVMSIMRLKYTIDDVGILFFALGNCLNFISFAYAAQV